MYTLKQCNGNWDSFYDVKSGALEMHRCIHWEPITKRKKRDYAYHTTVAAVFAIATALLIEITRII